MDNNGKKPLENEYRTSQVYKTLTGSGNSTVEKIAEGLGKAAANMDTVISAAAQGYQAAKNAPPPRPQDSPQGYTRQTGTYQYRPGQGTQPPTVQPPPVRPQSQVVQPPPQFVRRTQPYVRTHVQQPQAQTAQTASPSRRPDGVTPAPPPQMPPMRAVRKGSPAKYYIAGVMALFYALNFPMLELSQWAVFGVVVLLTFLLSGAIFRGKTELVPIAPPKAEPEPESKEEKKPQPEKKSATGNPEVDKIIDEGHDIIKKLRAANDAIPDEALSADIDRMERASADIFNYVAGHPEKAGQIRKFMNYYLPTTLKLLNSYERLSKQSVKGENISSTLFNIAGMMHTVADAFEKQLDSLYADEAMDISADITVFETMLKQEGFVEDKGTKLG